MMLRSAAFETCETLLAPGKKWRLSPYVQAALTAAGQTELALLVPVYQSVILDLLRLECLPPALVLLDAGSPAGIGAVAALDVLLAWHTACSLYGISPGIRQVCLRFKDARAAEAARPALDAFRQAVAARAETEPELSGLSLVAHWAASVLTGPGEPPNLVLIPFPFEQAASLNTWLGQLPQGSIVAGLEWQRPGATTAGLLAWRYQLLRQQRDWVAMGPCGQEYGRDLPAACTSCFPARRETLHLAGQPEQVTPAWTYSFIARQAAPAERDSFAPILEETLAQVVTGEVHLRYIGTARDKIVLAEHPDKANDNPGDEQWREYFKVCPGVSGASRLALERRAGMQFPRLRYGQWLHGSDLQPQQPYASRPDIYTANIRNEAAFYHFDRLPLAETFLKEYSPSIRAAVDEAGYRLFGFPTMHPFQHTVLDRVLTGRDILAIAATGGGKSECYILPAMLLPGLTIVISPLKSLIQDQYEQRLQDRYGLDYLSTYINGDISFYERQGRLRRMVLGHFKLVYLTPEQLERSYVLDALRQADQNIGLRYLAMDEAHCISQWGHDFRSSYLNIVQRLRDYGLAPHRIALTATASPLVRDDVCDELQLNKASLDEGGDVFIDSSNRPELNLVVHRVRRTEDKARLIVDVLRRLNGHGSAIIFMPHTGGPPEQPRDFGAPASIPREEYAGMVSPGVTPFSRYLQRQLGQPLALYHGSLDDKATDVADASRDEDGTLNLPTRQEEQRSFIKNEKRIMVATKGFGMGIDKQDIRLVIHRTPPANLEAYAQEAGRAGRDQQLATVILLVSDDRPQITNVRTDTYLSRTELPSDEDIQQFFIKQKYVRRQDVQAMLAFLRSNWPRRINGGLYFTNDLVMAAFDQYTRQPDLAGLDIPYDWPAFPPRKRSSAGETPEHSQILDTGYAYKNKCQYIGRILDVLFNNRPTLANRPLPVVNSVHETQILLCDFRLYDPERIIASPAYFGVYLRQAGVSPAELRRLLPDGYRVDLTPLAERLNRPLRETASMLQDIRYCEGHTGPYERWVGTLLNYKRFEAPRWVKLPNVYDPTTWRAYAGAPRRVKPAEGRRGLDDYFPRWVLNQPQGWEVIPGPSLEYPDLAAYVDAFMLRHDDRRRNDESNFAYLLNEYIDSGKCLRALMLGYLKTNEIIVGGNCYGCSVCVPDLKFERYPVAKRKEVVARLLSETIGLIQQVEKCSRQSPPLTLLEQLLAAIAAEDAQGRSGSVYLDSWLARLIQDDPEHQGALWLRLVGLEHERLRLSPQDLLLTLERLVRLTEGQAALRQLQDQLERYRRDRRYQSSWLPLTAQAAELNGRLEEWQAEAGLWQELIETISTGRPGKSTVALQRRALTRLIELYRPRGRLALPKQAAEFGLQLARLPDNSLKTAQEAYRVAIAQWDWSQVEAELTAPEAIHPAAALLAWLSLLPGERDRLAAVRWLEQNPATWAGWSVENLPPLAKSLEADLDRSPRLLLALADAFMQILIEPLTAAQYLLRAWVANEELSQGRLKWLAAHFAELDAAWCRQQLAGRAEKALALFMALICVHGQPAFPLAWLPSFPAGLVEQLPHDLLANLLETALAQQPRLGPSLTNTVLARLQRPDREGFIAVIVPLVDRYPEHPDMIWLRLHALEHDSLRLPPEVIPEIMERLISLAQARPEQQHLRELLERYQIDSRYQTVYLPLTLQAAELNGRLEDWTVEAGLWQQVLDPASPDSLGPALVRRALTRLLDLYRPSGRLADQKRAAEIGLRLARLPGNSLAEAQEAYDLVVHSWTWPQVEAELMADTVEHPAVILPGWLKTKRTEDEYMSVLAWLEQYPGRWTSWPPPVLLALIGYLEAEVDLPPQLRLAVANILIQHPDKPALIVQHLLRIGMDGVELPADLLLWLAGHLTQLEPALCLQILTATPPRRTRELATSLGIALAKARQADQAAKTLSRAAELLAALWRVQGTVSFPKAWVSYFPAGAAAYLPGELLANFIKGMAVQEKDLNDQWVTPLAIALQQPDNEILLSTAIQLSRQHRGLSLRLVQASLTCSKLQPAVVEALFPFFMGDYRNPTEVTTSLNELASRPELLRGDNAVALCLDNWKLMRADWATWPAFRAHRIEGSILVDLTNRWLKHVDRPHRLDMLVVILRDVRSRSATTWLTPVSLEFQALCAGGRYNEAEELTRDYENLTVKGRTAAEYLEFARKQRSPRQPEHTIEFKRLWELMK